MISLIVEGSIWGSLEIGVEMDERENLPSQLITFLRVAGGKKLPSFEKIFYSSLLSIAVKKTPRPKASWGGKGSFSLWLYSVM